MRLLTSNSPYRWRSSDRSCGSEHPTGGTGAQQWLQQRSDGSAVRTDGRGTTTAIAAVPQQAQTQPRPNFQFTHVDAHPAARTTTHANCTGHHINSGCSTRATRSRQHVVHGLDAPTLRGWRPTPRPPSLPAVQGSGRWRSSCPRRSSCGGPGVEWQRAVPAQGSSEPAAAARGRVT